MAWWLFQHLVVTAALAAAVAAVSRVTRIGPVGRHALWLVVLVKLVTPPIVLWPWAAPDPLRLSIAGLGADAGGLAAPVQPFTHETADTPAMRDAPAAGSSLDVPDGPPVTSTGLDGLLPAWAWRWAAFTWLAGSLVLLLIEGTRLTRLARRIRASAPADPVLQRRIAALSATLGVRPIETRVLPGGAPPAVWCFGRTRLLWPADLPAGTSAASIDGLILHELAHVKRRDPLIGWLELAAGVAWWWNPLFWYVRSALREQAELSCDAWVVRALPDGRRAYAGSLLALAGATAPRPGSLAVVGVTPSSRRMLERRLVMIMQGRASVRLTRLWLVTLAIVAATTLPAWATGQNPPVPPTPPVPTSVPVTAVAPPVERPAIPAPPPRTALARPATLGVPARVPVDPPSAVAPPPDVAPPAALPVTVPPSTVAPPPVDMPMLPAAPVAPVAVPARSDDQQARNGSIFGRVTGEAGAPLGGVTVRIESDALDKPLVTVTTTAGRYQFPVVPTGRYTVTFEAAGLRKVRPNVMILAGFNAEVNTTFAPAEPATSLPAEGAQMVVRFEQDQAQIRAEAEQRLETRQRAAVAALQALAEQYTKDGRLDDAAAIRRFLQSGALGGGSVRF